MFPRIGSCASASSQPHVEVQQSLSPARNLQAAVMPQQSVIGTPPRNRPADRSFLENTLGNKDLANLANWLDGITRNWALTGSTALKIWGYELNHKKAMEVTPHDADIVVTETDMVKILDKKSAADRQESATEQDKTFLFDQKLPVDLIASSAKKTAFGNITQDVKIIQNVPVVSLSALLKSKKAAMEIALKDGATEKYSQCVAHVALLNELITLQNKQPSPKRPARAQDTRQKLEKAARNLSQKMPAKPSGKRSIARDMEVAAAPEATTQSKRAAATLDSNQLSGAGRDRSKQARKQLTFDSPQRTPPDSSRDPAEKG